MIKHPVLTLHTFLDQNVPVAHESAYRNTVAAAGRQGLLVQTYTTGIGHCNFTTDQQLAAIQVIDDWAQSGILPAPSAFPPGFGFDRGFVPPP